MTHNSPKPSDTRAICQRLRAFVKQQYASQDNFCRETGIPDKTAQRWSRRVPGMPRVDSLLIIARDAKRRGARLSLDWLLLGDDEEPVASPAAKIRSAVESRCSGLVEKAYGVTFDQAWAAVADGKDDETVISQTAFNSLCELTVARASQIKSLKECTLSPAKQAEALKALDEVARGANASS